MLTMTAGMVFVAPAASAASLDCLPDWGSGDLTVGCSYNGTYRGAGSFFQQEPEFISACDGKADGRKLTTHLEYWKSGSRIHRTVTDSYGGECAIKFDGIVNGTKVWLWLCVEGIGCGQKYASYA